MEKNPDIVKPRCNEHILQSLLALRSIEVKLYNHAFHDKYVIIKMEVFPS